MKAAVLYGKEDVRLEEVASRSLQPGEVRVRVEAALTCGTDLKVFKRGYHARMIVPPAVFGHEWSGVIAEVTPEARDWRVGDRVTAANSAPCGACFHCGVAQEHLCADLLFLNGSYAEELVVPARIVQKNLLRLEPETTFLDAALTEPLACVVQGMEETGVGPGQRVAILGAGPIGLMFVALTTRAGARVTVSGRGEKRLAAAKRLGAERVGEVGTDLGGGFDVVIEAVGKPETWELAVRLVRKGGTVNFFGGCPAGTSVTLDTGLLHYSNLRLLASFHHTPRSIRRALQHIEQGAIRAKDFVDGSCPLSELPALFASMAQGNRAVKTAIDVRR